MSKKLDDKVKAYRTLKGFLSGEEHDEPAKFAYSATLRIFGQPLDFEEIGRALGLSPKATHRKGERKGPKSPPYPNDAWFYSPNLPEDQPLGMHIDALWVAIRPSRAFLLELKKSATVNVFLGYRSNVDFAGFAVSYQSLDMFRELEIPFDVSVVVL